MKPCNKIITMTRQTKLIQGPYALQYTFIHGGVVTDGYWFGK